MTGHETHCGHTQVTSGSTSTAGASWFTAGEALCDASNRQTHDGRPTILCPTSLSPDMHAPYGFSSSTLLASILREQLELSGI